MPSPTENPGGRNITVDHDEISGVVKNLESALGMFKDIKGQLNGVKDTLAADTRGANGETAPIYVPLKNAIEGAIGRVSSKIDDIEKTMQGHNETLAAYNTKAKNVAEEGAHSINAVEAHDH